MKYLHTLKYGVTKIKRVLDRSRIFRVLSDTKTRKTTCEHHLEWHRKIEFDRFFSAPRSTPVRVRVSFTLCTNFSEVFFNIISEGWCQRRNYSSSNFHFVDFIWDIRVPGYVPPGEKIYCRNLGTTSYLWKKFQKKFSERNFKRNVY